jgi:hypothetical protein
VSQKQNLDNNIFLNKQIRERKRETCAEIAELCFDLVQEGGCLIKRPGKIGFVLLQHVTVGFLHTYKETKDNLGSNLRPRFIYTAE